jgi:hypothetical protein
MDTKAKLFFLCGKMAAGINPREDLALRKDAVLLVPDFDRSRPRFTRGLLPVNEDDVSDWSVEFSVGEEAPSITFNG